MAKKNRLNRQRSAFERLKVAGKAPDGVASFEDYQDYLAQNAEKQRKILNSRLPLSDDERANIAFLKEQQTVYETMLASVEPIN